MTAKTNLTTRILSPTFWLDDLPGEIAVLAARNNVAQARREIETFLKEAIARAAVFPEDDIGRAALLLWILKNPKNLPRFAHRRDRDKLQVGSWKFRSVLQHRNYSRRRP